MFCNWNGLREDSLYRPTLYVSQFKSKAVFDSDFQSVLDYGFLVRETNGSGFRSLVGSWIPWWAECPGIRIPQAKISRIPEFGLPGDSKWLKDGMCFLWWPFYIFRSAAVRSGTEKFWGIRDNWKFRKFSKIYSLTDPLPTMYKRDPIGFARIFVSRPCWTHNSNYVRHDKE